MLKCFFLGSFTILFLLWGIQLNIRDVNSNSYPVKATGIQPRTEKENNKVISDSVDISNSSKQDSSNIKKINILHINDIHGTVEPFYDPEISKESLVGGLANTQTVLKNEKAKNPEGTLTVNAGDLADGSMVSDFSHGRVIGDALKPMGFDAVGLGNHDFCWGTGALQNIMEKMDVQGVAANVVDGSSKAESKPWKGIEPYIIKEINGVKVGVIGLDTPSTAKHISKKKLGKIKFRQPLKTLKKYLPRMRNEGADFVVVISHLGFDEDKEMAKAFKHDSLVIVGGHSHTALPEGHREGNSIIVQAGAQTQYVGNLEIDWDTKRREMVSTKASLIPVIDKDIEPDAEVQSKITPYLEALNKFGAQEKMGEVAEDLDFSHHDAKIINQIQADSILKGTGADFALTLSSSVRRHLKKGEVSKRELYDTLPFKDWKAVKVEATGKMVKALIEDGVDEGSRIMIPSGIKYTYDPSLPDGNRVTELTLSDGTPIEPGKTYTVVMDESLSKKPSMTNAKNKQDIGRIQKKFFNYFQSECPEGGWKNNPDDRITRL